MGNKISKIIVAQNIKVDRDYNNVIDADMLAVVQANQVASRDNYSFIRRNRNLQADFNYSQILNCNYMAFQNTDYSNKWFFAWIDNIEYINDSTVEIEFTIDIWATWFSSLQKLPVFVEREHVNNDGFARHSLPEPVKPDKMITNFTNYHYFTDFSIIVFWMPAQVTGGNPGYTLNHRYCCPARVFRYDADLPGLNALQNDLLPTGELANTTIISAFMIPTELIAEEGRTVKYLLWENANTETISFPAPVNLNGYVPVNNKLFTYPYSFISVSNGNAEKVYKHEKFGTGSGGAGTFKLISGVVPNGGASLYPMAYDGVVYENVPESLTLCDLPMIAISTDSYAAWLAQKSSGTVMQGIMSTLTGAMAGLKGGAIGAAAGATLGLASGVSSYMMQEEQARSEKDRVVGSNNVDIDLVSGLMGFVLQQRCAVADEAERIDRFFSQFGYNVSITKIPNYTGRQYWNYVKINGTAGYGAMPESARNELNRILNQGVTIWHSHDYLGNYFIGGSKMENPIV